MSMAAIRSYRKVPAKRGMTIRIVHTAETGQITSASGSSIRVRIGGKFYTLHPFDLDYLVDGQWQLGDTFLARFNGRIEKFNEWLNKPQGEQQNGITAQA